MQPIRVGLTNDLDSLDLVPITISVTRRRKSPKLSECHSFVLKRVAEPGRPLGSGQIAIGSAGDGVNAGTYPR